MKLQHGSVISVPGGPLQVVTAIFHGYVRAIPLGGSFETISQIFTEYKVEQEMISSAQTQEMLNTTYPAQYATASAS